MCTCTCKHITHHEHYSHSLHIMQCSKTNYSSLSSSCNSHKSTFTLCTLPLLLNIITEITILNKTLHKGAFLPNKYYFIYLKCHPNIAVKFQK